MARYSLAVRTAATATVAPILALRTAASDRARIVEIGIFLSAATQAQVGLARLNAAGTPSTSTSPLAVDPADGAPSLLVDSAWSAAPTIVANYMRRATLPAAIGAGLIWTFGPDDMIIPVSTQLLLWNFGAGSNPALDVYIVHEE